MNGLGHCKNYCATAEVLLPAKAISRKKAPTRMFMPGLTRGA
jgi:hypothetical protein